MRLRECCNSYEDTLHVLGCPGGKTRAPEIDPKTRPSRDEVMMKVAQTIALRSTCGRLQVGAIITREGRILSTGYNGSPARLPHCDHTCTCLIRQEDAYIHMPGCAAEPGCKFSVHAEANAIAFAARHGIGTEDANMFTTHDPCLNCAMLIINSGIRTVRSWVRYRDQAGVELLKDAQVRVLRH